MRQEWKSQETNDFETPLFTNLKLLNNQIIPCYFDYFLDIVI